MEKSREYKLLGKINFQGNKYNIYEDNKYRKFYLKIINNSNLINLAYPTLEEFIGLNKVFGMNYINDINLFLDKNNLSDKKRVRFIPKVITKTGLVSLSVALWLSGCGIKDSNAVNTSEPVSIEETAEDEQSKIEETVKPKTVEEMTDEEVLKYYGYQMNRVGLKTKRTLLEMYLME